MKNRDGFVSNSSSSSFVIKKRHLTSDQISQILDFKETAKELGNYDKSAKDLSEENGRFGWIDDFWTVGETLLTVHGSTIMDNFDMNKFLEHIGVSTDRIEWRD